MLEGPVLARIMISCRLDVKKENERKSLKIFCLASPLNLLSESLNIARVKRSFGSVVDQLRC